MTENIGKDLSNLANQKVLRELEEAEDEGLSFKQLQGRLNWTEIGLKSALGRLIKSGEVNKHHKYNHYFINNHKKVIEDTTEGLIKLSKARGMWLDKILSCFGLKRK